ncbi:uncharacterized protein [Lolium perenne]|uniref:uncharacterized protein n=1 Tax=Lolium perenne TaxID=4522 RepID=UPI0021EAD3D2|nr:uncharacterized protein LOC127332192 [Lolium perenne]
MVLNEYWGIPSDESDDSDVEMEEAPEVQPAKLLDVDKAIDFMRFVFKEGLAFLDNGSGRCLADRMFVDLGGFMVDTILEQPQREGPCRMRMLKPSFEYDLAHAFAKEARKGIAKELQGDFFGIFVDMCSPPDTYKYYMVLFARYVNCKGEVVERLLGIVPDSDISDSAPYLKATVLSMLSEAGLSLQSVRGQGYGLAGYSDKFFNQLTSMVDGKYTSAYYGHPHVCPLQSHLVAACYDQSELFELIRTFGVLSNLIQKSPQFTEKLCTLIQERGVNLDHDLQKPGETNWGSYYETIEKFALYTTPICDALDSVEEVSRDDVKFMVYKINQGLTYDFFFGLLLMQDVLGVTNELSLALDRKGWDAENFVALLHDARKQLQVMRDEGWTPFLNKVGMFCNDIDMPMVTMGEKFVPRRRSKDAEGTTKTYLDYYHVDFFQKVINKQLKELDRRFTKESSELCLLASCLNPRNSFQSFDKDKLVKFARFYPSEFSDSDTTTLELQLEAFIRDVRSDTRFLEMDMLSSLSARMVETGKNIAYPLVYLLLKLALILPGTPATAKTTSTAMKLIENAITREPCNQWISDCLLLFLEPDIFESITNDAVIPYLEAAGHTEPAA